MVPAPNDEAIGFPSPDTSRTQSPFSSDPFTDVLEMIFIYCARDYHTSHSGRPTHTPPNWANVPYVSRHWRCIALNCPIIWSYLFVTSPRWLEELLVRSKQAPLKIRFHADERESSNGLWFINQVLDHLERIRELRIEIPYTYKVFQVEALFSKMSSRAPCLQELALEFEGCCPQRADVLFGGDTPFLYALELSLCSVSWQSLDLTRLTTLRLCRIFEPSQRSIPELLETLKSMQNLTHLYLDRVLASAAGLLSSTEFKMSQKITLPRLSRLLLIAPLSTVIAFLSRVDIPLKAQVRLDCHDDSYLDQTPLSSLFQDRVSMPALKMHSLEIVCPVWGRATFAFSSSLSVPESEGEDPQLEWDEDVPLQAITHSRRRVNNFDSVIDVCCTLPLTHVQSVTVRYPYYPMLSMTFWKRALRYNHEIRHLKLSRGTFPGFSLVLCMLSIPLPRHDTAQNQDTSSVDHGPDRGGAATPVLDKLELRRMLFREPPDRLEVQALAEPSRCVEGCRAD